MSDLYVNSRLTIPATHLSWSASRSGGPGGQNVNKVNSRVTLRLNLNDCPGIDSGWRRRLSVQFGSRITVNGEFVLHSESNREQARNLADARTRLVEMLDSCSNPPKKRRRTKPTLGSKRRRLDAKKQTGDKKQSRSKRYRRGDP